MLVVTANWAFTDGSLRAAVHRPRTAREWLRRVQAAVVRCGFSRDGTYRPPAAIDIVLAGDTFDCLTSAVWRGRDRPWRGGALGAEARRCVLRGCVRRAAALLAGLARLRRTGLAVPAADHRGRPAPGAVARVPVRVAIISGDRDGPVMEHATAISARGVVVAEGWCDGVVLVRHGHEDDPACHRDDQAIDAGRAPTLAESVGVDLVTAFAAMLEAVAMPTRLTAPLISGLAAAGTLEIPAVVAGWVDAADRGGVDAAVRRSVVDAWHRAVDGWVRAARREPPECGATASPIEPLAAWFTAGGGEPPPRPLVRLLGRRPPDVPDGAARSVVLGHPAGGDPAGETICLGESPVRRLRHVSVVRADGGVGVVCVAGDPPPCGPPTVVWNRADERPEWRWLTGDHPAWNAATDGGPLIVDAA